MLGAILSLIGCQLAGELIREAAHLPIPGPVIGMFLLAALLAVRGGKAGDTIPPALSRAADTLIGTMGLLFVPAGVGIITEAHLLREEWRPIVAALIGSTVLSVAVTGVIMHRLTLPSRATQSSATKSRTPPDGIGGLHHE